MRAALRFMMMLYVYAFLAFVLRRETGIVLLL